MGKLRHVIYLLGYLIAPPCFFWAATPANAEIPLRAYRADADKTYITGVGRGIFWVNSYLQEYGAGEIFCPPPKLHLDAEIIASLLDQEIREPPSGKQWEADTPIEMIMVVAFLDRFPCNK